MKRVAILGAILLVLVGMMLLQRSQQRAVVASGPAETVSVNPERVSRLRIERPGEPAIELARIGGGWKLTTPIDYPAQDQMVQGVLKSFEELKLTDVVSRNPEKRIVFQVDSTGTRVQAWEAEAQVLDLVVGKAAPDYGHTYVRRTTGDEVYRAEGTLTYSFNRQPDDWRDKTILKLDESQISRVVLSYPEEKSLVTLSRVDSTWTYATASGKPAPADSATVARLLRAVSTLNTMNFASESEVAAADFSKPTFRLEVETDSGKHVVEFATAEGSRLLAKSDARDDVVFGLHTGSLAQIMKKPDDFKPAAKAS